MSIKQKKSCIKIDLPSLLKKEGIKATSQRLALGALLFNGSPKHFTAEQLLADARKKRIKISLATVYNTLHQFKKMGLLQELVIDPSRTFFDTTIKSHYHFFDEETETLFDVPPHYLQIHRLPPLPPGRALDRIDVFLHLCKKKSSRK